MNCQQTIRWMGIELCVPTAWQVVRHSLSPARGQLALIDRYRQRMTLHWTQCRDEPDLDRLVEDYRAQQLEAHSDAKIDELMGIADWVGTRRRFEDSGERVTQAVRYDAATRRLIEAAITPPSDADDEALVEAILSGVAVAEPADAVTHWRAFDLDVKLPASEDGAAQWRLRSAKVKPADVTLSFAQFAPGRWNRRLPTGAEVTVRRMGMADAWFDGDTARFLRGQFAGARGAPAEQRYGGGSVLAARGWEAGPPIKRMLGLLRRRQDLAWHDQRCNAVMHLSVSSYRKRPVEAESIEVTCEESHD